MPQVSATSSPTGRRSSQHRPSATRFAKNPAPLPPEERTAESVERVARAFEAMDIAKGQAAMEDLRKAIEDGDTFPSAILVKEYVAQYIKDPREAKQRLGSGIISLEEYGKFASLDGVKDELTERFGEMRAIRADKSIPLAEQDRRVRKIADDVNETIRTFNARDDYRQRSIAYAASHLTGSAPGTLDEGTRERYAALLKGVPKNEIVRALIRFGNEFVTVKNRGVNVRRSRWSSNNINERVARLLMLTQGRD